MGTSADIQGDVSSTAEHHPMQHRTSPCMDPEGTSSSGGAASDPPATSEQEVSESGWFQPPLSGTLYSYPACHPGHVWSQPPLLGTLQRYPA